MGQIPIVRGAGDAQALANAVEALREGSCIGVFPEGTRSKGRVMRARSGVGRLALEVPEAQVRCVAVSGTADLTGFPRRPRIKVRFFEPAGGQPRPDEDPGDLSARLLAEIRAIAPPTLAYRKREQGRSRLLAGGGAGALEGASRCRRRRSSRCRSPGRALVAAEAVERMAGVGDLAACRRGRVIVPRREAAAPLLGSGSPWAIEERRPGFRAGAGAGGVRRRCPC